MVHFNIIAFQSCLFGVALIQSATGTLRASSGLPERVLLSNGAHHLTPRYDQENCPKGVMVDLGDGLVCTHMMKPPPFHTNSSADPFLLKGLLGDHNPIPKIPLPKEVADRLKLVLNFGISLLGPEGAFINLFVNLLWPGVEEKTVWEQVQEQVTRLVDGKILQKEMEQNGAHLDGLSNTLLMYANAVGDEKGNLLSAMLVDMNIFREYIFQSSNKLHMLPLAQITATMHLGLLRERLDFGTTMYDHDNSVVWKQELIQAADSYAKMFSNAVDEWMDWRPTTIRANQWEDWTFIVIGVKYTQFAEVVDDISGDRFNYDDSWNSIGGYFQETVDGGGLKMRNQAKLELAKAIEPVFYLHRLVPGRSTEKANVFSSLVELEAGPYTPSTLGLGYQYSTKNTNNGITNTGGTSFSGTSATECSTDSGTASCVSSLQFGSGDVIGNPGTNQASAFSFAAPAGARIYGVRASMDKTSIRGIQFVYSQNEAENPTVWSPFYGQQEFNANIDAVASSGYELIEVQYKQNPARGASGLTGIKFKYKFVGW